MILNLIATLLKLGRRRTPRYHATDPRILVIRRNRMGDMIYTLPLLSALRRHFPQAHITVVCEPLGAPIAQACPAVNEVLLLHHGLFSTFRNAWYMQDYDWAVAAKGGFDRRLATLIRLTNAAIRIGFERSKSGKSVYYTDPVPIPPNQNEEHQIDMLLRLLKPMGLIKATEYSGDLKLRVPDVSRKFVDEILATPPFDFNPRFALINFSSTVGLKFHEEDFIAVARRIVGATDLSVGFVAAPADQQKAAEVAECMGSKRVTSIQTPSPMDLAALLERAAFLLTPEGGAAHLAAAMGTPALVLWSEGPFKKWYSRSKNHSFVHAQPDEKRIPLERVWDALQPLLPPINEAAARPELGEPEPPLDLPS